MAVRGAQNWSLRPGQLLWKLSDRARQFRESSILSAEAALGKRGEDLAHRYLRQVGFTVVARNYRPGADSEVDIVARRGDLLVFVEVKTRTSADAGNPERAIDLEKQQHIARAARSYVTRAGVEWNKVRFDTISVVLSHPPSIVHHEDAFFHGRAN
jgi:putative endonuclease